MCGICGELRFDDGRVDRGVLLAMREQLHHRGPDSDGLYVSPALLGDGNVPVVTPTVTATIFRQKTD